MDDEDEAPIDPPAEVKNSNDTPAMKMYREKMAQRKAAQEAKKSTPKSKANLNKAVTPQKTNSNTSFTTPSVQRRLRRSSVVPDTDSASSDGSVLSSASMGSKIKQLSGVSEPAPKTNKETLSTPRPVRKLPKIPKVNIVRVEIPASPESVSDYGTMSDTGLDSASVTNNKSDFGKTTRHSNKNLAHKRLQTLRKSLGAENDKQVPKKRTRSSLSTDFNDNDSEMLDQSKLMTISRSKDKVRLNNLEKRVQKNSIVEINKIRQVKVDNEETTDDAIRPLDIKYGTIDSFCEQMDWEPIEDEQITSEVSFRLSENFQSIKYNNGSLFILIILGVYCEASAVRETS